MKEFFDLDVSLVLTDDQMKRITKYLIDKERNGEI
jgi:hypothetical protein